MTNTIELENQYCAHNYQPLPVVIVKGEGVYLWDDKGNKYLDMMSAYSAVSHGHCHPRLVTALTDQAKKLAITSRAFHTEKLALLAKRLVELTSFDKVLPMNTGAEAVETALKAARKWAYRIKGVAHDKAEIIICDGNFHGRTITLVGMSSEPKYQDGFGPFPAGFKRIPYGDANALAAAITPNTAAFLVEPIQGEAGIILPPPGYLAECANICKLQNVLLICDEIQTGLGRTGKLLASQHENVKPDGVVLGKALGGGLLPLSVFLASEELMAVFTPGDHGSTFGGNPLACAVGIEALNVLIEEKLIENSAQLGAYFLQRLHDLDSPLIRAVRGKGLFVALEIEPSKASARSVCEQLMTHGILSKETHDTVVRLAPPLVINQAQLDTAIEKIKVTLQELDRLKRPQ